MKTEMDSILDLNSLRDFYFCANTPVYLYTHFRRDASVQLLAKKVDANRLISCLKDLSKEQTNETMLFVRIYAILAALSHKLQSELGELRTFAIPNVEWFERIKLLVFEDAPNAYVFEFNLWKPPVPLKEPARKTSEVTSSSASYTFSNPRDL
jgi:hypothetical protein